MNNISIDNIIYKDNIINIEDEIKHIIITGNSKINIFNANITNLIIEVKNNSFLEINYFNNIDSLKTIIDIKVMDNSIINFNYSFINNCSYELIINSDFLSDNSNININICGINDKGIGEIKANGYIKEKKNDNELNESIKILNINNGKSISMPNMFINNCNVKANHNNTIAQLNKNELFYLMSKGIDYISAKKLIRNGFILKNINDSELRIKTIEFLNRR